MVTDATPHRLGIDAGSKTVKAVVLDEDDRVVFSTYRRHRADILHTLTDVLHDLNWRCGNLEATVAVTGSASMQLAEHMGAPFVQEVVATTRAVQQALPHADPFIELGGEDAKVVHLADGVEQRMNATCAGGTGGFIDTIAFMLGVRSTEMSRLANGARHVYPIASRCAVFAQTDVRPLLNAGASKADIAASAFDAVVRQALGGGLRADAQFAEPSRFSEAPLSTCPTWCNASARRWGSTRKAASSRATRTCSPHAAPRCFRPAPTTTATRRAPARPPSSCGAFARSTRLRTTSSTCRRCSRARAR